jgi:RNA polymerase sigma-70 factor (ECF subfamily)
MSGKSVDDLELLNGVRNNDQKSFRMFIERYEHDVAATVIGMLGNTPEADDIGQETFVRFFESVQNFRGDSSVKTYITRIAINLSLNELKRRQRFKNRFSFFKDGQYEEQPDLNESKSPLEEKELKEQVHSAIKSLKPEYRAVVILRMIQGYDTNETSEILDIPVGTVLSRLSRALDKLKIILKPFYETDQIGT